MTWTLPTPEPVDGPLTGPERPMLEAHLASARATLLAVCAGLTGEQLAARPVPTSTLSLLGLVRHLAKVERIWFRQRAVRAPVGPTYDLALGVDHDFEATVAADAPADLERFREECRLADEAVAGMDLDDVFEVHGKDFSLRMTYLHLIAEYSRHNGHADLLREAVDGVTGR